MRFDRVSVWQEVCFVKKHYHHCSGFSSTEGRRLFAPHQCIPENSPR